MRTRCHPTLQVSQRRRKENEKEIPPNPAGVPRKGGKRRERDSKRNSRRVSLANRTPRGQQSPGRIWLVRG